VYIDPDGERLRPIYSTYRMNQQGKTWNDPTYFLGSSTSAEFRRQGCLVSTVSNILVSYRSDTSLTPKIINDMNKRYFDIKLGDGSISQTDLNTAKVLSDYDLVFSRGGENNSGSKNMDLIQEVVKAETEYAVIVKVHYKNSQSKDENGKDVTTEDTHFVTVSSVFEGTIDGKKGRWIEIGASSEYDLSGGAFSTYRPLDTWKQKDGKVYVHEDSIRRVDTVREDKSVIKRPKGAR